MQNMKKWSKIIKTPFVFKIISINCDDFNYARPSTIADEVFIFLLKFIKLSEKISFIIDFDLTNSLWKNY